MNNEVRHAAQLANVYGICVAMVRYTFVQSCHRSSFDALRMWLQDDDISKRGKIVLKRHLAEVERESFVTWNDPDEAWSPCRIAHATKRDTVLELEDAMRAFPVFGIHHPWLPEAEPQTQTFRKGTDGTSIERIVDYSAGSSCLLCGCYQNVDTCHLVTIFLEKFKPEDNEQGVEKFVKALAHADAMARSVWQPDVGTIPFNACKDMGWLTKAGKSHSSFFLLNIVIPHVSGWRC